MTGSIKAIDWPLATSTSKDLEGQKATHPKTPYQPHDSTSRRRLIITFVVLGLSIASAAISASLYIYYIRQNSIPGWPLLTWFVVSAGMTAMLALLAPLMYRNYLAAKRAGNDDGVIEMSWRALDRDNIGHDLATPARPQPQPMHTGTYTRHRTNIFNALADNDSGNAKQYAALPSTPSYTHVSEFDKQPNSAETTNFSFPLDIFEIRGRMPGQDCPPPAVKKARSNEYPTPISHMQTPITPIDDHTDPLHSPSEITPPPRFPSPAQLRAQESSRTRLLVADSDDPFGSDDSPNSKVSSKTEEDQVARSDSLKKLREATLRRKQAFERLN